jgi:hypothetical protein
MHLKEQRMKAVEWTITPRALARIVGAGGGRPAPDGPDFDPGGPIGPIAFEVARQLAGRADAVALNPQPIPPVEDVARLLARQFVSDQWRLQQLAAALAGEAGGAVTRRLSTRGDEFVHWCGTGALQQLIAELLRRYGGPRGGGEPPPRPNEIDLGLVQLAIGAELFHAGALVGGLEAAGTRLMQQGLKALG